MKEITSSLLNNFDRIAEAPDAVPRLRRFILDLAVRGKLVEQDSNDESTSELLRQIRVERARLVKAGEVGKPKPSTDIQPNELPIAIPKSWAWVRLCDIGTLSGGMTPSKNRADYWDGEVVWLSPKDIKADTVTDSELKISSKGLSDTRLKLFPTGSLFMVARSGILKRTFPVAINRIPAASNQDLKVLVPYLRGAERFMQIMFRGLTDFILRDLVKTGTTVQSLKYAEFAVQPFPLPPLAEQHRIVAKVDELMALCDRLEAAQNKREQRRDRLEAASLNRINQPAPSAEGEAATAFREHARFHLAHLTRLTTRPEHIKSLRQSILNLAVLGRLVPQDPNDEPASDLLARKVSLPKGYKRRRKILKETSVDAPGSLFPSIPLTWEYATVQSLYDLNAIVDYADGKHGSLYPRSNEFGDEGVTFVTAKDLANGRVIWKSCAKLNQERASQLTKGWAQGGDVLLTHNATVGRVARVDAKVGRFLLGTSVTFYRLNSAVLCPDFFYHMLNSSMWQGQLEAIMAQTTRNQVSIQKQAYFRVVVPPLAEQRRIVAKVDELMAVCDQLESRLTTTQTDSRRLLEAVLLEALAPAREKAA